MDTAESHLRAATAAYQQAVVDHFERQPRTHVYTDAELEHAKRYLTLTSGEDVTDVVNINTTFIVSALRTSDNTLTMIPEMIKLFVPRGDSTKKLEMPDMCPQCHKLEITYTVQNLSL
jgi:hypothetical protein